MITATENKKTEMQNLKYIFDYITYILKQNSTDDHGTLRIFSLIRFIFFIWK